MPAFTDTLIDTDEGIYQRDAVVDAASTNLDLGEDSWSIRLKRLQGGSSDGVDVICVDNGHLSLHVVPTRGMGIWKAQCGDLPLKWDSPVGMPVHPSLVDQSRRGGIGWLDGFNELICRCGLGWHGAPGNDVKTDGDGNVVAEQFLPLHGRIANLPAHRVTIDVSEDGYLSITGIVDERSVFGERLRLTSVLTSQVGSSTFSITDTVTNLGGSPAEVEILYHCNFGAPLLSAGSVFQTAAKRVAPRDVRAAEGIGTWETFEGPTPGYAEQVYFVTPVAGEADQGLAVLSSADSESAVALRFDTTTMPWFTLWKNTQPTEDGYCCGMEPSSSLPNNRGFEREQGRVQELGAGHSIEFQLAFEIAHTAVDTRALISEVETLQKRHDRRTESSPAADLSPAS